MTSLSKSPIPSTPNPTPSPEPAWLTSLNELADSHAHDDHMLVEIFIMYLDAHQLGPAFMRFYTEPPGASAAPAS